MGNRTSQPSRPEGLRQLNDSVWELYCPEGVPKVEVIFFHGLQSSDCREAFWKTWLSRDSKVVWPREWLGPSLGNARISSISYDSSAVRDTEGIFGRSRMSQIVENLVHDIVFSGLFNIDEDSTVILVGHSMGGLVIKQLLLKCMEMKRIFASDTLPKKRINTFLRNCRGIFFYSTPHGGSKLAAYAGVANFFFGGNLNMPIIDFLNVLSSETARINNDFNYVRRNHKLEVATRAIGELYGIPLFLGFDKRVVSDASARQDADLYYSAKANHYEVCKAENNSSSIIFMFLLDFCMSCSAAEAVSEVPAVPTYWPPPSYDIIVRNEANRLEEPLRGLQLNESVYELYRPEGVPEMEVIFFHGLQLSDYREAFWRTWLSRDDTVVWPKKWLGPSLQSAGHLNARISSISYDSSAKSTSCYGRTEMFQIIENLVHDVVLSPNFNIDRNSSVILVGHGMGGLIIKQLLLKCLEVKGKLNSNNSIQKSQKNRIKTFLRNCRGIFYYSTPHLGSRWGDLLARANRIPSSKLNIPISNFLRTLSSETAVINNAFTTVRSNLKVVTRGVGEWRDTRFAGHFIRMVEELSARYDTDLYFVVNADHFEDCKAESVDSNIFTILKDFCLELCPGLPELPDASNM